VEKLGNVQKDEGEPHRGREAAAPSAER